MKLTILGGVLIVIAILISLHQYGMGYPLFQWDDIHHESWIIMFAFAGIIVTLIARGRL